MPAVDARALTRRYGDRVALDGVSLSVEPGEVFSLLGPNGGGKTTLFRILATLMPPTSGTFTVNGLAPTTDLRALRRALGVVFQAPSLDKKLTVWENVRIQGQLYGLPGQTLRQRGEELLRRFSILDRRDDLVEKLSGGLARRVELAKALLHRPSVVLLDEPSTGLDPGARRDLRETLREMARKEGTAVLLTTHLFDEAEAADRIGILDRGHLLALGTPRELKQELGGEVLVVETPEAEDAPRLAGEIVGRFGSAAGSPTTIGATVRLHPEVPHEFIPVLVEAFPGRFRSVTLGAPSLEDVFVERTGRRFREADE